MTGKMWYDKKVSWEGSAMRAVFHYIRNTDLYLLLLALCCSGYSLALVYSTTYADGTRTQFYVQLWAIVLGVGCFIVVSLIDMEDLARYWKWLYLANVLLQLLLLTPLGQSAGGNHSWLRWGVLGLQPAELGKVLFICTFAAHIARARDELAHALLPLGLHLVALAALIVYTSDDVGMVLAYFAIAAVMLFAAGLSLKWFAGGLVLLIAAVPFVWQLLKSYQINRILVLFDPSIDPAISWHTRQSKIALGAGQLTGRGFLAGNQVQYGMLPESHTDFIFSAAGEEFGFVGCVAILALLGLLILRLLYVTYTGASPFSSLIAAGIAGMFLFQTFENIYMCLGLFPVVGLTLPLFSYGGSSVVTMYLALGLAAGVRMREKPSWLQR